MHRIPIMVTLLLLCTVVPSLAYNELLVSFYTEQVRVHYTDDFLGVPPPVISEQGLEAHFQQLAATDYPVLLNSLRQAQKAFQLNDWLYYEFVEAALFKICGQKTAVERTLVTWLLLSKSGFDTRLAYFGEEVFLYAYTEDELFERAMIKDEGRSYVGLTQVEAKQREQPVYLLSFKGNPAGRPFSFQLLELPELRPNLRERRVRFFYEGHWQELTVTVDVNTAAYMEGYPIVEETKYLEVPFSKALSESLYPKLRQMLKGKNEWQSAELIVAFTRSAFVYREDKEQFGCSKPMIAEEVFVHPYSDCEDRVALFYQLARELMGLPMIVIAYADHLSIAVALPEARGSSIRYEGKNYYICDPTGPAESQEVGLAPNGYENETFHILKNYP